MRLNSREKVIISDNGHHLTGIFTDLKFRECGHFQRMLPSLNKIFKKIKYKPVLSLKLNLKLAKYVAKGVFSQEGGGIEYREREQKYGY